MASRNALSVSVLANIDSLRAAMATSASVIATTRQEAQKLSNAFDGSKIIAQAGAIVKRIDEMGGVAKLTSAEQAKINKTLDEAVQKYEALGQKAPAAMVALQKATADAAKPAEAMSSSYLSMTASFVSAEAVIGSVKTGFNLLVGAVKEAVVAANEAEHAHAQVTAALRAQGQATPAVAAAYGDYATALQKTTIYQDDALEGAEALLVTVGNVMPKDMNNALKAVTNLASGMNIDLTTAAQNVAKAAEGNVGSLRKMGVEVDASKVKAQGFGVVLDAINDKFAGQAAAIAGTYEGRLTQLANTWNNVEESVGRAITTNRTVLELLDAINGTIDTNTKEMNQNATVNNLVSDAAILSVRAFSALVEAIDLAQRGGSEFMVTLHNIVEAMANMGIVTLEAGKAIALVSGHGSLIEPYNQSIGALRLALVLLDAENEQTRRHSLDFSRALDEIRGKADALARQLEGTRGQTFQLAGAFGGGGGGGGGAAGGLAGSLDELAEHWATAAYSIAQSMRMTKEQYDAITETSLAAVQAYFQVQGLVRKGLDGVPLPPPVSLTSPSFLYLRDIASPGGPDDPFLGMPKATASGEFIKSKQSGGAFQLGANLSTTIVSAITGGGNAYDAAGSYVGQQLGTKISSTLAKGSDFFSKGIGAAMSGAIPVIGALAGPLLSSIVGVFQKGAYANDLRDSLKEKFGDAAGAGLQAFVDKLGNAQGVQEAYRRFMTAGNQKDVQSAFDDLTAAADKATSTMQKYGLSLDDLQTPLQRVTALANDAGQLKALGFGDDKIAMGMADGLNATIKAALDGQTKIPAALEPVLGAFVRGGGLADDLKNKILGLADPVPWQDMQSAAESLGIDVGQLGDKFNTAKWSSIVSDTADKFKLLTDNGTDAAVIIAGIDTNTNGVKDAIEGLVQSSEKFGTEIPANARPMIEALMRAGELTDDNGDKLTDLTKLTFGTDVSEQWQTIIDKLGELIDRISGPGGLNDTINNVAQPKINWPPLPGSTFTPEQSANYQSSYGDLSKGTFVGNQWVPTIEKAHQGAIVLANRIKRYHAGAARVIPFPQLSVDEFPAILQSGEAVLNRRAVQQVGEPAIAAMNRGDGAGRGAVITFAPVINVHPSPGMSDTQLADRVAISLERNTNGILSRVKRVVNGR